MSVLPDGEHDVFVIDATPARPRPDSTSSSTSSDGTSSDGTSSASPDSAFNSDGPGQVWMLDLTIVSGPHKGEVVTVRAEHLDGDEFDLMGMPATLTVTDGRPTVRIDR